MSAEEIPPQATFLYNGSFTKEMDNTFIRSLLAQKSTNRWDSAEIPEDALQVARLEVNHYHGTRVGWAEVVQRNHELVERYKTYKFVSNFKGVDPDWPNNRVNADDKIWRKMFKKMSLSKAYRHTGEPEFRNLLILYGDNKIKKEKTKSAVAVGSTPRLGSETDRTIVICDDDEVSSPVVKNTCRKLFDDEQSSTTNVDPRFVFIPPKEGVQFPPRNFVPFKYMPTQPKDGGSQGGSSSGSNLTPNYVWGPFQ